MPLLLVRLALAVSSSRDASTATVRKMLARSRLRDGRIALLDVPGQIRIRARGNQQPSIDSRAAQSPDGTLGHGCGGYAFRSLPETALISAWSWLRFHVPAGAERPRLSVRIL